MDTSNFTLNSLVRFIVTVLILIGFIAATIYTALLFMEYLETRTATEETNTLVCLQVDAYPNVLYRCITEDKICWYDPEIKELECEG